MEKRSKLIMVNFFTLMFLLTVTRLLARWYLVTRNKSQKNIIIYGAGQAGVQISNAISVLDEYRIVAFIDDDPELKNVRISDIRVFHSRENQDKHNLILLFLILKILQKRNV